MANDEAPIPVVVMNPGDIRGSSAAAAPPNDLLGFLDPEFYGDLRNAQVYTKSILPLAASDEDSVEIQILGGTYFALTKMTMIVTLDDNVTFLPFMPLLVQIENTNPGTKMFSAPVHANEVFGDANLPYILPMPYLVAPNATLQITIGNLSALELNIRLSLHGINFYEGSDNKTGRMNQ